MTTITASAVKELREITGVAMMDCKKALVETNGNMEEAKNFLRKKGQAKALKKSSRETREGAVGFSSSEDGKTAGLVQVTCETDFVARNEKFQEFIKKLADQVSVNGENDLLQQNLINGEGNVEGMLTDTIAELGENMQILNSMKFKINHGLIGGYIHSNGKIGVAVPLETDQPCNDDRLKSLAKDIAMHIAAFQAEAVKPDQVPEEVLEKEKEVLGMYLSGHPLLKYAEDLEEFSNFDFTEKVKGGNGEKVRVGGSITEVKMHFDRKNNQMAFFKLDCLGGQSEILAFSDTFAKYKELIKNDSVVFITGKPTDDTDFSNLKLIADEIVTVEKARDIYSKNVNIRLEPNQMSPTDVDALLTMAKDHEGGCGLMFHMTSERGKQQRIYAHNVKVSAHSSFLKKLRDTYGKQNVWVSD